MSMIRVFVSSKGSAPIVSFDSATGYVSPGQPAGTVVQIDLAEWQKTYPGRNIEKAALDLRDFAYEDRDGNKIAPDWDYRQNMIMKSDVGMPEINYYDNYEIHPCVLLDDNNQVVSKNDPAGRFYEACNESDENIAIWTVYGHLPTGGIDTLVDCKTREEAVRVYDAMHNQMQLKQRLIGMAQDANLHTNSRSWAAQSVIEVLQNQSREALLRHKEAKPDGHEFAQDQVMQPRFGS